MTVGASLVVLMIALIAATLFSVTWYLWGRD
jgi:hypothetical protein